MGWNKGEISDTFLRLLNIPNELVEEDGSLSLEGERVAILDPMNSEPGQNPRRALEALGKLHTGGGRDKTRDRDLGM